MKENNTNLPLSTEDNSKPEIVFYQPDETIQLEVRMEEDTVWLTQAQMAELFGKDQSVIARHIINIFNEKELDENSNMQILHNTISKFKPTKFYNLDVIISVGYRVKSQKGVNFRRWANHILKQYIINGYVHRNELQVIENSIFKHEERITTLEKELDFHLKRSLPPTEGIFFSGQVFDAYVFVSQLIEQANNRIILIDNYIDVSVLTWLDKRKNGVKAQIYTKGFSAQMQLDLQRHNAQYPPISISTLPNIHDRFLIIDDTLYHIGASIKDLGKKLFAFTKMEMNAEAMMTMLGI